MRAMTLAKALLVVVAGLAVAAEPAPAPAPAPAAPPAGGGEKAQPPTKMIIGAVGAVVAIVVLILLVKFVIGLFSTSYSVPGVSPKLDSPENCAKTYAEFKVLEAWSKYEVTMSRAGENQAYAKSLADFYEDKKEYEKTLELGQKKMKLYNRSEERRVGKECRL